MARGFARVFPELAFIGFASVAGVVAIAACNSSATAEPTDAGFPDADGGSEASSNTTPSPFTEAAMRAAASAFNAKFCPALAKCDGALLQFLYGTLDECLAAGGNMEIATWVEGVVERYVADLTAPYGYGSLLTPDALLACAAALDFSTCDAFVRFRSEGLVPDACRATVYGSLPNGSSCRLWNQCQSGRCNGPGNGACGQCVPTQAVGGPCHGAYFSCPPGSVCAGEEQLDATCKAYRDRGAPCDRLMPCHPNLRCSAGICADNVPDAPCETSDDCPQSLVICNSATKKCEPQPFVKIGEPCAQSTALSAVCARGGVCAQVHDTDAGVDDAGAPLPTFACIPLIEDGHVCTFDYVDFPCKTPDSVCYQHACQQNGPAQCSGPIAAP